MKSKTVFFCTECGNEYPKWQGQCTACKSWNTIVEQETRVSAGKSGVKTQASNGGPARPRLISQVDPSAEIRFGTGMEELDRVLGGGAVKGSLVLVGGAPGIGKSTLLLQICDHLTRMAKVLYVSGEESERQIRLRAERLGVANAGVYVLSQTNLDDVLEAVRELKPNILIVDSIQTLYNDQISSTAGSVAQVKDCTLKLMQLAKSEAVTVFVIGHINKEGAIAGPKVLEHMVDCVLYFEGTSQMSARMLRAAKNRFGSTNEVGVFEMRDIGLVEVANPSEMLLSGRPKGAPGTCVACVMEGSRPLLAEIQALVATSSFNLPRRMTDGFDYNRAVLLMAVLEKRGGLKLGGCDAYLNVVGGLSLDEPAADLPAVIALASSFLDKAVDDSLAALGEVGLTGELRAVSYLEQRLAEIKRLGFTKCVLPKQGTAKLRGPDGLELIKVRTIREALEAVVK